MFAEKQKLVADLEAYGAGHGGGATELDDLTDVNAATPTNGQVLQFNGGQWAPRDVDGGGRSPTDVVNVRDFASVQDAFDEINRRARICFNGDVPPNLGIYFPTGIYGYDSRHSSKKIII